MIATALLALTMAASQSKCAPSEACPLVLTDSTGSWARAVEPAQIDLSASGPLIYGLHWRTYNGTRAVATGMAEGVLAGCKTPAYECPVAKRPITVTMLHAVRGGAGKWFFSRMHVDGAVGAMGIAANESVTPRGYWG